MGVPVAVVLINAVTQWYCPNCATTDVTPAACPNRWHHCPGLHMLTAPLIPAGTRCKVTAEERADYLGGETQAAGDDGKPYMAVRTTRDDGDDVAVNAGLATAHIRDYR